MELIHFWSWSGRFPNYDSGGIKRRLILLLFSTFLVTLLEAHPLKMSVATLTFDAGKKVYILDIRLFLDDFLVVTGVLKDENNPYGQLLSAPSRNDLRFYLSEQLGIHFNATQQEWKIDKMKVEDLTVHLVLEIRSLLLPEQIRQVQIIDTIFVDRFVNQRNVFHIELPGKKRKTLLFNQYHRMENIEW